MKKIELPQSPSPAQPPRELPWVVYVEDEEDNWIVTELQLRRRFHLAWAKDDRAAFELLRQPPRPLHAILMDIQLRGAGMDGIQLTRALRGMTPAAELPEYARALTPVVAPIIFVTAYGSRYSEAELLAAGGSSVIPKPVDFVALSLALTSAHLQRIHENLQPLPRP
ncbi:response regulator [Hyalangium rubrum]|uniref:Response regulator n=1 Tax=Hyalangium rubrum TaxID=3103134 RepID=A0ABU5GZ19_9BACT|nr:response regulator [Hyalangium sp. s54d21]MDY7226448.1 response regulator [Hyalangium sp. s54d21]